jgi:uncharacterized LabA/DUF88 family protein
VSKNVAVFVDVANIFYAAKAAGADIDYVTLLKAAVAGRDFVRAYAYTGLDPENENQRNFHSFLARHGYKVVSKDIRKYGDGKVKANLDIELVVDMMKTARNLDVAIVVSGDGDFAPAIRAVQEMGVRVEVISFRGNTSSDLIEVADAFYDITQVARVDRDSSRSGRRVSGDEEDLSMTEVPDKQTEGRGGRRGRGRGRYGRSESVDEVAAVPAEGRAGRPAGRGVAARTASRGSGGRLVALPGEKLSRAGAAAEGGEPVDEELLDETADETAEVAEAAQVAEGDVAESGESTARRRRRRGGRGRGRGHAHEEGDLQVAEAGDAEEAEGEVALPPPPTRPNQFGSVWDSQIGMAGRPEGLTPLTADEDDFAEPEIPEYLLAEKRRGGRGQGQGQGRGGGRGVRSAYASAVDRERYGRSSSRFPEPARQPQAQQPRRRDERPPRQSQPQQRRGVVMPRSGGRDSAEPWTEVPPELEEILRAQLSTKLSRQTAAPAEVSADQPVAAAEAAEPKTAARRGGRRKVEPEAPTKPAEGTEASAEKPKPAPRGRRKPAASAESRKSAVGASDSGEATAPTESAAPKRRAPTRRKAAAGSKAPEASGGGEPAGE